MVQYDDSEYGAEGDDGDRRMFESEEDQASGDAFENTG